MKWQKKGYVNIKDTKNSQMPVVPASGAIYSSTYDTKQLQCKSMAKLISQFCSEIQLTICLSKENGVI